MVHVQPRIDENMIRPPFITTATDLNETRSHYQLTHIVCTITRTMPAQSAPTSREAAKDACGDEWRPKSRRHAHHQTQTSEDYSTGSRVNSKGGKQRRRLGVQACSVMHTLGRRRDAGEQLARGETKTAWISLSHLGGHRWCEYLGNQTSEKAPQRQIFNL